ncbi:hypothetical protein DFP72DRAFT_903114 [Ephemerocybe angulata]|uniref:MYND-type domain-containing protein n=1 Tax=Ephemerocybe angulata TaxID=980116 RepID=A0A8H6HUT2_9AGAR|nr:hypothetical protein DFP72DRAFT_903114 [Tulosesus angulatus]
MTTGYAIFQNAERAYMLEHNTKKALDLYQKAIKRIMQKENVLTVMFAHRPRGLTNDMPSETLAMAFRNFCGFFRDPAMNFTEATAPEAYKFLSSFRPNSENKDFARFTSTRGQFLLKCLQISALGTLGLLAWDAKDRAKAAKRYKEALELAASEPLLTTAKPAAGLETWVAQDLRETRDNLRMLVQNDESNEEMLRMMGVQGGTTRREEVLVPNVRVEAREGNTPIQQGSVMSATDKCGKCGIRDVKMSRCSRCKKMPYCGPMCQKEDWKTHKLNCVPAA